MPIKLIIIDINGESQLKITFPFKFVYIDDNDEEKDIQKEDEIGKTLNDILQGRYLLIKKEKINRKILGKKIDEKGDLQFYLFPKVQLTSTQLDCTTNIMVVGERGVGKSAWIHAFLNYMQGIQIEENIRYIILIFMSYLISSLNKNFLISKINFNFIYFLMKKKSKINLLKNILYDELVGVLQIYQKYIIYNLQFYLIIQLD